MLMWTEVIRGLYEKVALKDENNLGSSWSRPGKNGPSVG